MRIDLHSHTSDWSDGKNTAVEMVQAAIANGLDGLVITDHDRFLGPDEQAALNARFPRFRVFRGCEATMAKSEHILLIGGTGEAPPAGITAVQMREHVRRTGAWSALAHPFWREFAWTFDFEDFCPEGMAVMSLNVDTSMRARTEFLRVARQHDMQLVAGSDAHRTDEVGMFHVDLDADVRTDDELVRELRAGRFRTAAHDGLLRAREEEIAREEGLAGSIIARGGTLEDFQAQGGMACFFTRVAKGGSYFPDRSLLGIRSADFGITPSRR